MLKFIINHSLFSLIFYLLRAANFCRSSFSQLYALSPHTAKAKIQSIIFYNIATTRLRQQIVDADMRQLYTAKRKTKSISNIRLYEKLGYKIFKEEAVSQELQFVYLQKC